MLRAGVVVIVTDAPFAVAFTLTCETSDDDSVKPTPGVTDPTNVFAGMPVPFTGLWRSAEMTWVSWTVAIPLVTTAVSMRVTAAFETAGLLVLPAIASSQP